MNNYSYYLKYTLQYTQKIQLCNKFTKTFRRKPLPGLTVVPESGRIKPLTYCCPVKAAECRTGRDRTGAASGGQSKPRLSGTEQNRRFTPRWNDTAIPHGRRQQKTAAVRCARGAEGPQASAGKTVAPLRTGSPEPTRYRPTAVCARNKNKHCRITKHSAPPFVWLAGFFRKAGAVAFSWNGKLLQSEDTGSGYVSKSRGNHIKSGGFCKAEHQIHVLHRLSCSAFYHIVKHRYYLQHPSVVDGIYLHIAVI